MRITKMFQKSSTPQRIITMSWMYVFIPIAWGAVVSSYTVELTMLLQTVDGAGRCWSPCARPLLSSLCSSTSSAVTWFVPEITLASQETRPLTLQHEDENYSRVFYAVLKTQHKGSHSFSARSTSGL
ncbi:unnamed protein product [Arctogadus glacialis]